jgi:hypothetical protein
MQSGEGRCPARRGARIGERTSGYAGGLQPLFRSSDCAATKPTADVTSATGKTTTLRTIAFASRTPSHPCVAVSVVRIMPLPNSAVMSDARRSDGA